MMFLKWLGTATGIAGATLVALTGRWDSLDTTTAIQFGIFMLLLAAVFDIRSRLAQMIDILDQIESNTRPE